MTILIEMTKLTKSLCKAEAFYYLEGDLMVEINLKKLIFKLMDHAYNGMNP